MPNKQINPKVAALKKGDLTTTYKPPTANIECWCNTVMYDLISACAVCQNHTVPTWLGWIPKCSPIALTIGSYPQPIPSDTRIPDYAYWDPTVLGSFNATLARSFKPSPNVTNSGNTTGSGAGDSHEGKPTNIGAIVGGVVGGVVILGLVGTLLWLYLRERRRNRTVVRDSGYLISPSPFFAEPAPQTSQSNIHTSETASRVYDSNYPATYPSTPTHAHGYANPYPPDLAIQPPSYQPFHPGDYARTPERQDLLPRPFSK